MAEKTNAAAAVPVQKRCWKKISKWCGIMLGIIVLLLLILSLTLEHVLEAAIPPLGSALTGTKVEISGVRLYPRWGSFQLKGLKIANPQGFHNPTAIEIGKLTVGVNLFSLFTDTIVVNYVEISGMRLDYEYRLSGSNLDKLLQNLQQKEEQENEQSKAQKKAQTQKTEKPEAPESSKNVRIKRVVMENNQIAFSSSMLKTSIPVILPPLTLIDIGGDGSSLIKNIVEIFGKLLEAVVREVNLQKLGNSAVNAGSSLLDTAADTGEQLGKAGSDAAEKIGKTVKDLFQ